MPTLRSLALLALVVVAPPFASGCSSEPEDPPREPLVVDANARLAPQEVADAAIVADDSVSFASTAKTKAWAEKLAAGHVIAGNRNSKAKDGASKNRRGFLRKVVSVTMSDPIVVATTRADLADLMQGDLHVGGETPEASIFGDAPAAPALATQALQPLDDSSSGSGGNEGVTKGLELDGGLSVKLHDGKLRFNSKFEADFALRTKWKVPVGVSYAFASLTLDPELSFVVDFKGEGKTATVLSMGAPKKIDLGKIELFLAGPVPVTVEIGPVFECKAGLGGKLDMSTTTTVKGHFKGGFHYDKDSGTKLEVDGPTFSNEVKLNSVTGQASAMASCSVKMSVGVYAFDALGIEGSFGPEVTYEAKVCGAMQGGESASGASVSRALLLNAQLNATAKVPFLDYELVSTPIFSKDFELKKDFLVGSETTCKCEQKEGALTCSPG